MAGSDLSKKLADATAALRTGEVVVDAAIEPARAASALAASLASGTPVWLRALPEPGAPSGDGYGPAPRDGAWVRVTKGEAELELLSHGARIDVVRARAEALAVSVTTLAWGTSAAPSTKHLARGVLTLEPGGDMIVAATVADDETASRAAVVAVVAPLASLLGLELGAVAAPSQEPTETATTAASSRDVGRELLRFTFGWEGDRRVLRDLAHPGPRASGWIWTMIALASGAGALATLARLTSTLSAGASWTSSAAHAGVAAVFALGAFAFFHVARHAIRYRAAGAPIAVFADDRVVVMPWVRRDGAIDPKPEGRFGAGVRIAEIRKVHVVDRDGVATVSLDTEHGAIDLAGGLGAEALEVLRGSVEAAGAAVAAPRRKTAIMRARERNQREAEA